MKEIRKKIRLLAFFNLLLIIGEILLPSFYTYTYGLSNGPSSPEFSKFTASGLSQLVDPFSGDFSYQVPLLDIDGYPLSLSYNSNVNGETEATWVGLGWNLNTGAISRQMKGLPDDIDGEGVKKTLHIENNYSINFSFEKGGSSPTELFGLPMQAGTSYSLGLVYNNYKGLGVSSGVDASLKFGPVKAGVGLDHNSFNGLSLNPSITLSGQLNEAENKSLNGSASLSTSMNSRSGMQMVSFNTGLSLDQNYGKDEFGNDKGNNITGASGGVNLSFARPSFTPFNQQEMSLFGIDLQFKKGKAIAPSVFTNTTYSLGFNTQNNIKNDSEITTNGYGYLYLQNAYRDKDYLLDFNREKDGITAVEKPYLAIPSLTYDVWSASAEGFSATFRPFRNDVSVITEAVKETKTKANVSIGGEVALPITSPPPATNYHFGLNVTTTNHYGKSGTNGTDFTRAFPFVKQEEKSTLKELVYFKSTSDKSIDKLYKYSNLGFDDVVAPTMKGESFVPKVGSITSSNNFIDYISNKAVRTARANVFSFITNSEAKKFGMYRKRTFLKTNIDNISLGSSKINHNRAENNQLGEIYCTKNDGSKFIYGLPLYTKRQTEISFNASGYNDNVNAKKKEGKVLYNVSGTKIIGIKGKDKFYSKTVLPDYAHTYLLTDYKTNDYVDIKQDGITPDDLGNSIHVNYTITDDNFGWRTPLVKDNNVAGFDPQLRTISDDDKGNIVHGAKEVAYVHSMESKNYIAIFKITKRLDGLGAFGTDVNKGIDTSKKQYKLDNIFIYSKQDYFKDSTNAIPIKTVHFVYDYSLCRFTPNNKNTFNNDTNNNGKLTLKSVYFTYGSSKMGKLSRYNFAYSGMNPDYNSQFIDRWGNYQQTGIMSARDNPYSYQKNRATHADLYASAWLLNTISTPNGEKITVDYESDDYAYVQGKKALQMFTIDAIDFSPAFTNNSQLYQGVVKRKNADYIRINLDVPVKNKEDFLHKYIEPLEDCNNQLYFKVLTNVIDRRGDYEEKEYIQGLASIIEYDVDLGSQNLSTGKYEKGWIRIASASIDDEDGIQVQAFTKATLDFIRMNLPDNIYPTIKFNEIEGISAESVLEGSMKVVGTLMGAVSEMKKVLRGLYKSMMDKGMGRYIDKERSFVRLGCPSDKKIGGGARVKKVMFSDEWKTMTANQSKSLSFGYKYEYTDSVKSWGAYKKISSGVCSYEPILGGDENPHFSFRIWTKENNPMALNDKFNIPEPIEESHFPGASVGYSKVKITPISNEPGGSKVGYSLYEFYTHRDFPTLVSYTDIQGIYAPAKSKNLFSTILGKMKESKLIQGQGYCVVLNDMAGKQKAVSVIGNANNQISKTKYFYKTEKGDNKKLNNRVTVLSKDSIINPSARMGVEVDFIADYRETSGYDKKRNIGANLDLTVTPIPFPIPTCWPSKNGTIDTFRSLVFNKVVYKSGILERVENYTENAKTTMYNYAYDAVTAEPILTYNVNLNNDTTFQLKTPAYWIYDQMAPSYHNANAEINSNYSKSMLYFNSGDKVAYFDTVNNNYNFAWFFVNTKNQPLWMDSNGLIINKFRKNTLLKILDEGKKNMLDAYAGTIVYASQKIVEKQYIQKLQIKNVINADASEYSDDWGMFCCTVNENDVMFKKTTISSMANPFLRGLKNLWRKKKDWVYFGERIQSTPIKQRSDGYIKNYSHFWKYDSKYLKVLPTYNSLSWVWKNEITKYSPFGSPIETVDPLGRYNSSLYSYNNTLSLNLTENARYTDQVYDGMETKPSDSFTYKNYVNWMRNPHWRIYNSDRHKGAISKYTDAESHTGLYSLLVYKKGIAKQRDSITANVNSCGTVKEKLNGYAYQINKSDCNGYFYPTGGQKYVLSVWAKLADNNCSVTNYNNINVVVKLRGANKVIVDSVIFSPSGPIINGWQKIEGTFNLLPYGQHNDLRIDLWSTSASNVYYDDIRIHPLNSNMRSFVYHPISLKLMAQLDENNFSTFFQYDKEGNLTRIKKETVNGIRNVKESRVNIPKLK